MIVGIAGFAIKDAVDTWERQGVDLTSILANLGLRYDALSRYGYRLSPDSDRRGSDVHHFYRPT